MRKRLLVVAMLCAFLGSAALTVFSDALAGGCMRCKKQGCPQGFCYFDCQSCCYWDPHYPYPVCFK